ncbi:MAG: DUF4919 domain-containing protein [Bacteroidales bacterium]|jgi:hypothetical protein|nr:DUF4919 domain-containing protein [Bacteroidales bacterium]
MKKFTILLTLFTSLFLSAFSQEDAFFKAPDFDQIRRDVKEPASSFYYPNLLEKYLNSDANMTPEEGRHLYFGYIYQAGYVPTDTSSYNNLLAKALTKKSFTAEDYSHILAYSDALLQEDPFNLRALNAKLLVYAQQNNTVEYKKAARKRRIVQDAIVGTGDGMTENTPYYVIKVAHEYDILPFMGFSFGGEDKILKGNKVNYLSLGKNRFGVERVYFNIKPVIEHVTMRGGGKM